jgi:hypothetical protein
MKHIRFISWLVFIALLCQGISLAADFGTQNSRSSVDGWAIEQEGAGKVDSVTPKKTSDKNGAWSNAWDDKPANKPNTPTTPTRPQNHLDNDLAAANNVVKMAVEALQESNVTLFKSLLDDDCARRIEKLGQRFEMISPAGKAAAMGLATSLQQAKPTIRESKIIHYETRVAGTLYSFYVSFDDASKTWKLGGI